MSVKGVTDDERVKLSNKVKLNQEEDKSIQMSKVPSSLEAQQVRSNSKEFDDFIRQPSSQQRGKAKFLHEGGSEQQGIMAQSPVSYFRIIIDKSYYNYFCLDQDRPGPNEYK